ncbi:MAG: hypothetical protein ACKO0M_10450 [Cyanobium sp.]
MVSGLPSASHGNPVGSPPSASPSGGRPLPGTRTAPEPVLCGHCGRTASNGISCIGMCVADSGY